MPLEKIVLQPGINTTRTQTLNEGSWSKSNLIRWKDGHLEKVGGWQTLSSHSFSGTVRFMHPFQSLQGDKIIGAGTDNGLQVYSNNGNSIDFLDLVSSHDIAAANVLPIAVPSATVNIHYPNHGFSAVTFFVFGMSMNVGNRLVRAGTYVMSLIVDADNFQFTPNVTLSSASTSAAPVFTNVGIGSSLISCLLTGHGLSIGNSFTVEVQTSVYNCVLAGSYTVTSVVDANHFQFDSGTIALGVETVSENGGLARIGFFNNDPVDGTQWSVDNLGNDMLASNENGPIYVWTPPVSSGLVANNIITGPQANFQMIVGMPQAQVIALGSSSGNEVQDPLLIRWSDAGTYDVWTASATNQAGSYRLSRGSRIEGALQTTQTTLVWTDIDLWSMQYAGTPYIYSFTIVGTGCGLIAPHAAATLGKKNYWMSQKGFFAYGDAGVQPLRCDVWDDIFPNIDADNVEKIIAGANSSFNEVWFFYPVTGGNGECSKYVKMTLVGDQVLWDYGEMIRTAWFDQSVFGTPVGAGSSGQMEQHEIGYNDGANFAMAGVYAETGYIDVTNGADMLFIDQIIPDLKWFGTDDNASISVKVRALDYPGGNEMVYGPFSVTSTLKMITPRIRARQIAFRFEWDARQNFSARLGACRYRGNPNGRRP